MQNTSKDPQDLSRIDILLVDQFSNHCLANALEPLRAANALLRQQVYAWRFLTLTGAPATSSSGLPVLPDGSLSAPSEADALFVISGYGHRWLDAPGVARPLRRAARRARLVVGFDTGAWAMAAAGLLSGRRATIHWELLESFAERFPDVQAVRERFVEDGDRVTCGGAMAAFDLVLGMIKARFGEALRLDVAALFMHAPALAPFTDHVKARPGPVARAVTLMEESLDQPLAIAEIARRLGRSQKDLERRFRREFDASPGAIYRRLRLSTARRLAEGGDLSVAEIAVRCGYENASALTRAFKRAYGVPPTALRR